MSVEFPLYILARDSGEIQRFDSIVHLQQHLEKIDVENAEYFAWDMSGHPVSLTVQEPSWLSLEAAVGSQQPDLQSCLEQLANSVGVDSRLNAPSAQEFTRVYDLIESRRRATGTWLSKFLRVMGRQ
jgi:hypothetical protein